MYTGLFLSAFVKGTMRAYIVQSYYHSGLLDDIYIYIYIYIYCHPLKDCFIVSQLFNVAKNLESFKLGLEPTKLYVRLNIIPPSIQST